MQKAIFKKVEQGYYTFEFDNGAIIVFEEIDARILHRYDLKNDTSIVGMTFNIKFSELFTEGEEDLIIYRLDNIHLIS